MELQLSGRIALAAKIVFCFFYGLREFVLWCFSLLLLNVINIVYTTVDVCCVYKAVKLHLSAHSVGSLN